MKNPEKKRIQGVVVRPVVPADEQAVTDLFRSWPDGPTPNVGALFRNRSPEDVVGYGLFFEDSCTGFLGIITDAAVGKRPNAVNLTLWFVLPEFRGHSMDLQDAVLGLNPQVITALSVIPPLVRTYKRRGFRVIEDSYVLIPYLGWGLQRPVSVHSEKVSNLHGVSMETYSSLFPHVHVLSFHDDVGGAMCTLLYNVVRRRFKGVNTRTAFVIEISDSLSFAHLVPHFQREIYHRHNVRLIQADRRFLASMPRWSLVRPYPIPKFAWFADGDVQPQNLTYTFTEFALLAL